MVKFELQTGTWGSAQPLQRITVGPAEYARRMGEPLPIEAELPTDLQRLVGRAKRAGVELCLRDDPRHISLLWISRGRNHSVPTAPKGRGAQIVWLLCRYADKRRRQVWLEVIDGPKMVRYYRQFGFQVSRDYGNGEDYEMIREPR